MELRISAAVADSEAPGNNWAAVVPRVRITKVPRSTRANDQISTRGLQGRAHLERELPVRKRRL